MADHSKSVFINVLTGAVMAMILLLVVAVFVRVLSWVWP